MSDLGKPHSPPRRARRFPADLLPNLKATILAGPDVRVINVSKFGMLIESDVRLSPNASVCLNITLEGRTFPASGRVLRVDAALSGGRVKYRAGVALDSEVAAFDVEVDDERAAPPAPAAAPVPAPAPAPAPAAAAGAAPAKAAKPAPPQPQTRPAAQPQAPPAAPPQPPRPAADTASPQQAQELQLLRTALKTSEAQRKELTAALEAERARWDDQRREHEQSTAEARQLAADLQKQIANAQKDSASAQKDSAAAQKDLAGAQKELSAAQKDLTNAKKELAGAQQESAAARKELASTREELTAALKQAAGVREAEKAHAKAQAAWEAERTAFEKRSKEADSRAAHLMKELREAAEREKALESKYSEESAAWDKDRRQLQQAMEDAAARADRASRELANARENEKRLSRKIDEQAESIDAFLADKRRMESEIESLRAAAAVAEEAAASYEQERTEWASHKQTLTDRLELSEKLCTDQKDLLFHLRQQIGEAFALIDSWDPAAAGSSDDQAQPEGEEKISAVQRLRKIIG
jgi:predicted  nucleic acid-binding Zn-ribbon protein